MSDNCQQDLGPGPYAISIDVGGTSMKIGIAHPSGRLCFKSKAPTPQTGPEDLVREVGRQVALVKQAIAGAELEGEAAWAEGYSPEAVSGQVLETIGVAVPGVVDERSGMAVASANLGWRDFAMREALSAELAAPVVLCHDVRSGALAEARWGLETPDAFFVALGTGIAAGVVLEGRLMSRGGYTGETGQLMLENPDHAWAEAHGGPEGIEAMVRMEALSSAAAIERRYNRLVGLEGEEKVGTREVFKRWQEGDAAAEHVVLTSIEVLGQSIAGAVTTLGPLPVILGGGLSNEGQHYLDRVREATEKYLNIIPVPDFHLAVLGSWAQCLGVGAQVFDACQVPTYLPGKCCCGGEEG